MKYLGKKWKLVTIIYFILCYIYVISIKHMPISKLLLFYGGFILLTMILFLGTTIGLIGILIQNITKNDAKASKFYKIAYALKTNHISVLSSYGLILLKEDHINKSLEIFKIALSLQPDFLPSKIIKCNIAICNWKLGNINEAIDIYEKIFKDFEKSIDEDDITSETEEEKEEYTITTNDYVYAQDYTTLGYLYLLKKDYDKAIENSKKALILNENYAAALDNLGQIYYETNEYDKAIKNLKSALVINPNMADSNYYMGLIYEKQDNIKEAKRYYTKAASCNFNALNTVKKEDVEMKLKEI
ncbi:MAG: tetratricopeptide repeat protein [Vallitalea sp.]|nr:tetratricopeptide repeat protein [Vallitalea sp.]